MDASGYGLVQVMGYCRGLTKPLKIQVLHAPLPYTSNPPQMAQNWHAQLIDVIMAVSMTQECSIDCIVAKEKGSSWKMRETIGVRNNQLLK